MGYTVLKGVVVIGAGDSVLQARSAALAHNLVCTVVYTTPLNGWQLFMVIPSGSKEGWNDAVVYNNRLFNFIELLKERQSVHWFEFEYDMEQKLLLGPVPWPRFIPRRCPFCGTAPSYTQSYDDAALQKHSIKCSFILCPARPEVWSMRVEEAYEKWNNEPKEKQR